MITIQEIVQQITKQEKALAKLPKRKPKIYPYVVIVNKQQYDELLKAYPNYISNNIDNYVLIYPDPQDKIPRGYCFVPQYREWGVISFKEHDKRSCSSCAWGFPLNFFL